MKKYIVLLCAAVMSISSVFGLKEKPEALDLSDYIAHLGEKELSTGSSSFDFDGLDDAQKDSPSSHGDDRKRDYQRMVVQNQANQLVSEIGYLITKVGKPFVPDLSEFPATFSHEAAYLFMKHREDLELARILKQDPEPIIRAYHQKMGPIREKDKADLIEEQKRAYDADKKLLSKKIRKLLAMVPFLYNNHVFLTFYNVESVTFSNNFGWERMIPFSYGSEKNRNLMKLWHYLDESQRCTLRRIIEGPVAKKKKPEAIYGSAQEGLFEGYKKTPQNIYGSDEGWS